MLRSRSRPVTIVDASIRRLVADMLTTMRHARGVGLAAIQVGVPLRVMVADAGPGPVVLVNPRMRRRWGTQVGPEGCLSIPGAVGTVRRARGVEVDGRSLLGRRVVVRGTGFLARIIQHELDHLNGVLFIDRTRSRRGIPAGPAPRNAMARSLDGHARALPGRLSPRTQGGPPRPARMRSRAKPARR